ncbi:uncharacterized protein LOC123554958 [Mercenaria mercenaria]|uniref:uncharacterized protein LOC123554958 n=1 Tax=Mercenaria mercenaria TaxID=6596 RepID=UPI00234EE894|nr:uncharacterized protein LOC123554958 [Mercenaria mercenaria]
MDLQKLFILFLLLFSVITLLLYINSRSGNVTISSQVFPVIANGTRKNNFISNIEDNVSRNKNGSPDSNTFNMNVNVNVTLNDLSNTVNAILHHLETVQGKRTFVTNEVKENIDAAVTTSDMKKNEGYSKLSTEVKYILTLFSTWRKANETKYIHRNTLRNWASFKPSVNVIIFTNDVDVAKKAKAFGCQVSKIPKTTSSGLPILKHMYLEAMRYSDSYFYGFANSDILFTDGLLLTLLTLTYKMRDMFISSPILVTGNRWNVPNITENEILRRKDIEEMIKHRGSFFAISAEEYFILSYNYPWSDIPDLAIGVVAYDNWLVMNARMKGHYTIDTTKTILVLHQDLDNYYYRSHFRNESTYNKNLLKNLYQTEIPYHKGFANCIEMYTDLLNDSVVIEKRNVDRYCNE